MSQSFRPPSQEETILSPVTFRVVHAAQGPSTDSKPRYPCLSLHCRYCGQISLSPTALRTSRIVVFLYQLSEDLLAQIWLIHHILRPRMVDKR